MSIEAISSLANKLRVARAQFNFARKTLWATKTEEERALALRDAFIFQEKVATLLECLEVATRGAAEDFRCRGYFRNLA